MAAARGRQAEEWHFTGRGSRAVPLIEQCLCHFWEVPKAAAQAAATDPREQAAMFHTETMCAVLKQSVLEFVGHSAAWSSVQICV